MRRLLDTSVKYFDSFQNNFEQLKVEWGETVKMLDVTLCNGTTPINVLSITTKEDENTKYEGKYWISSITLEGNPLGLYRNLSVVEIQNCSDSKYNREFRVQGVNGNTIKVAFDKKEFPDKPADVVSIEGTTLRQPPLGYKIVDQQEHKRLYTSVDPYFNCRLRVDNACPPTYDPSWAKFSRVSIYSETDSIDDYEVTSTRSKAPYYINNPNRAEEHSGSGSGGSFGYTKWYQNFYGGGESLRESSGYKSRPSPWRILGDDKTFYFFCNDGSQYDDRWGVNAFGRYRNYLDLNSDLNCMLISWANSTVDSWVQFHLRGDLPQLDNYSGKYMLNPFQSNTYFQNESLSFALWSIGISGGVSGSEKSYSSIVPTNPKINLFPVYMRCMGGVSTIIGIMRGYHYIGTDLGYLIARGELGIGSVRFDKEQEKFFVFLPAQGYGNRVYADGWVSFSLENWDED